MRQSPAGAGQVMSIKTIQVTNRAPSEAATDVAASVWSNWTIHTGNGPGSGPRRVTAGRRSPVSCRAMSGAQGGVLVVGSVNADLVVSVARRPGAGETVLGSDLATFPGGKGANQAVAAARLGARVAFAGRVGTDSFGRFLREGLDREGVDTRHAHPDELRKQRCEQHPVYDARAEFGA